MPKASKTEKADKAKAVKIGEEKKQVKKVAKKKITKPESGPKKIENAKKSVKDPSSGNGEKAKKKSHKKKPYRYVSKKPPVAAPVYAPRPITSESGPTTRSQIPGSRTKLPSEELSKNDTSTQADTSSRPHSNYTNRFGQESAIQIRNFLFGSYGNAIPMETSAPVLTLQQPMGKEENEVGEVTSTSAEEENEFADLPELIPFDQEDFVEDDDDHCEITFYGIPDIPAKRWLSADTEVGKRVLQYLKLDYEERGDMPRADTVEEAVDCISVVIKMEKVIRDSQHIKDITEVLEQLHVPHCPLFLYNHIRIWTMELGEYMKKRNREMLDVATKLRNESPTSSRVLNIKQEIAEAGDVSQFQTRAARIVAEILDDCDQTRALPVARTEREGFECYTLLFLDQWPRANRVMIDFYDHFKPHPVSTWKGMYNALRDLYKGRQAFYLKRFNQFSAVNQFLQAKKLRALEAARAAEAEVIPKTEQDGDAEAP